MIGYKGREVKNGCSSKVYYNLHKHTFSVQQCGLVVLHSDTVVLNEVEFTVRESGRQRVLMEKRKNVHAFVNGFLSLGAEEIDSGYREATYNPYLYDSFVDKETGQRINKADKVILKDKKIFYKKG
ncbi:hypothetical protein 043JT007_278 [Bacillus phage 043JT007]|nr:hypothetical protein 043JT007_10 [Bacillus phage 043JT007]QZA70059.1 hypothetical protein 043JT007_278 [Bacillus phage 043JT007]